MSLPAAIWICWKFWKTLSAFVSDKCKWGFLSWLLTMCFCKNYLSFKEYCAWGENNDNRSKVRDVAPWKIKQGKSFSRMLVSLLLNLFAFVIYAPKSKLLKISPSLISHPSFDTLPTVKEMKGKILFCQMSDYLLRQIKMWVWLLLHNMTLDS